MDGAEGNIFADATDTTKVAFIKGDFLRRVVGNDKSVDCNPVSFKPFVKCPAPPNEGDRHCTQIEAAHISRLLSTLMEPLPLPFASLEEGSMRLAEAP